MNLVPYVKNENVTSHEVARKSLLDKANQTRPNRKAFQNYSSHPSFTRRAWTQDVAQSLIFLHGGLSLPGATLPLAWGCGEPEKFSEILYVHYFFLCFGMIRFFIFLVSEENMSLRMHCTLKQELHLVYWSLAPRWIQSPSFVFW